ncbi:MAG: RidA family protein [Labrys sp. (in: a-proteobacteria)]|jgi:enamine deaminase RidA (YjgF/YER057c/UK114 family)
MSPEQRLAELGIVLPTVPAPIGTFLPGVLHRGVLTLAGQGPLLDDGTYARGKVGQTVDVATAALHARRTGLVLLAAARTVLGSLDRVERVINVFGMVNAVPDFTEHPKVINGCSDLFVEVFGEAGRHARAADGMGSLPMNISVEITAVMAVRD